MIWSMSMSTRWVEVDCDFGVWLLLPREIPPSLWPDDLSWAMDQAQAVWDDSGLRHRRKDVKELVTLLIQNRAFMAGRAWSHLSYLHLPDPRMGPLAASVSVWRAQGDRDQALRFYSGADLPGSPEVEEFTTENLGTGLRALSHPATTGRPDDPAAVLSYAWRVKDDTDVSLLLLTSDTARLREALPDVDTFARGIRVVPDPDPVAEEPEEDEIRIDAPSYLHVLDRIEGIAGDL